MRGIEDRGQRFSIWLLRPYLDLGPGDMGPLHAVAVEEAWAAFDEPTRPHFVPQRALPPGFRPLLIKEAGSVYDVHDPRDLPSAARTDRWEAVCTALHNWH